MSQKKSKEKTLQQRGKNAVNELAKHVPHGEAYRAVKAALEDDDVQHACAELSSKSPKKLEELLEVVKARANYLSEVKPPDSLSHYVAKGPPKWVAAQVVAALTDFSPQWLYDCATNRREYISDGTSDASLSATDTDHSDKS